MAWHATTRSCAVCHLRRAMRRGVPLASTVARAYHFSVVRASSRSYTSARAVGRMYQSAVSSTHTATTIRPKCIEAALFTAGQSARLMTVRVTRLGETCLGR